MSFVCAISREVPSEPVVSPASGAVFERRLIEKHLADNDTDPVNGEPLTVDQLVAVTPPKVVIPRPAAATSLPSLIKLFQDEWDSMMLETFKLRQHVDTVRQELSHALYQHDAACRVIARLTRERDQARQALAALGANGAALATQEAQVAAAPADESAAAMDVDGGATEALPAAVVEKITATSKNLAKARKKRAKPADIPGLATHAEIAAMTEKSTHSGYHSAGTPGVTAMALHATNNDLVLSGGLDKKVVLYNVAEESIVSTMKGHTKKVNSVILHPTSDVAISASEDKSIRVWNSASGAKQHLIKSHSGPVTGVSLHPTGDYFVSCSEDAHWGLHDIESGEKLAMVKDTAGSGLCCTAIHPDGLIMGTGTDSSVIRIWDIKGQSNIANFEGHQGKVSGIAFSENGYYLATCGEDSVVQLWDLRKPLNFKTLKLDGAAVSTLSFDHSGAYLLVGGNDIRVFDTKEWNCLTTLSGHVEPVTGVAFGKNAKKIVSSSLDRTVRVWA